MARANIIKAIMEDDGLLILYVVLLRICPGGVNFAYTGKAECTGYDSESDG